MLCTFIRFSKCFKQGGGFDLKKGQISHTQQRRSRHINSDVKKVKSVTLNRDEVDTLIQISNKLPTIMDKMLLTKDVSDSDSDFAEPAARKLKGKKLTMGKVSSFSSDDSDSDTENAVTKCKASTTKKQVKTKSAHPYRKTSEQEKTCPKES